jgi:cell wall-associated NlpC family hydrolase
MFNHLIIIVAILVLSSCASAPLPRQPAVKTPDPIETITGPLTTQLYDYYFAWQDTPYRTGGLSKKGVDCSGLVHLLYRHIAGIDLPRTSKAQSKIGRTISPDQLRPGDLVFFKTGWFSHHVGVHIEGGRFLHSSTKKGVIISSLQEYYWKNSFYLAKRIDIP